jgi:acetyl-CoA carboxylase / biotin carboxylase 1
MQQQMEDMLFQVLVHMCADPTARGNVLEAEGAVEIKFRKHDLLKLMARTDPVLRSLHAERRDAAACSSTAAAAGVNDSAVCERQDQLLPVYHSIALHFAGMHDTPVRLWTLCFFTIHLLI